VKRYLLAALILSLFSGLTGAIITTVIIGTPIGGSTSGSVLYVDSNNQLAQDNSNLFWDATNHKLGIGTTSPAYQETIQGSNPIASFNLTDNTAYGAFRYSENGTTQGSLQFIGSQFATSGRRNHLELFNNTATGDIDMYPNGAKAFSVDHLGHGTFFGTAPTVGTCGTSPSVTSTSTDNAGTINVGSGVVTACTLTFATTWAATPSCVISDNSTTSTGDISSVSTTAFTASFSASLGSGKIYYHCF
jgi:hypothetical protein